MGGPIRGATIKQVTPFHAASIKKDNIPISCSSWEVEVMVAWRQSLKDLFEL